MRNAIFFYEISCDSSQVVRKSVNESAELYSHHAFFGHWHKVSSNSKSICPTKKSQYSTESTRSGEKNKILWSFPTLLSSKLELFPLG